MEGILAIIVGWVVVALIISAFKNKGKNSDSDIDKIIEQAKKDGKRVAVPKVIGDEMIFIWLDDLSRVELGYCNIPEPMDNGPEAVDETALVMMPGLAFDPEGHRCGYGGGFYDRYLELHPHHPTIAMCYGFQMYDHLDVDAHDIPVDVVLSQEVIG